VIVQRCNFNCPDFPPNPPDEIVAHTCAYALPAIYIGQTIREFAEYWQKHLVPRTGTYNEGIPSSICDLAYTLPRTVVGNPVHTIGDWVPGSAADPLPNYGPPSTVYYGNPPKTDLPYGLPGPGSRFWRDPTSPYDPTWIP
jgi:hypothetical protein